MTLRSTNRKFEDDRLEKLKELARNLARDYDRAARDLEYKTLPAIAKQYRETIREIEDMEGLETDDEISEIIKKRAVEGKAGAVR